jgi:methylated-DNA-[protein]-cysteine S-methyltransferase
MRHHKTGSQSREWLYRLEDTPLGPLSLYFTAAGLSALEFGGPKPRSGQAPLPASLKPVIEKVKQELADYFAGRSTDFSKLSLDPRGTAFQLKVWQELRKIPRGSAISYRELARRAGSPKGFRAVGQANAANPIPLIIPCHRVIAADGTLGGYSSGLERKRWLLRHEGAMSGG